METLAGSSREQDDRRVRDHLKASCARAAVFRDVVNVKQRSQSSNRFEPFVDQQWTAHPIQSTSLVLPQTLSKNATVEAGARSTSRQALINSQCSVSY
jgi:hypothetical protein